MSDSLWHEVWMNFTSSCFASACNTPTFSFECLRRRSSIDEAPPSPSCTALPLHLMQQQVHIYRYANVTGQKCGRCADRSLFHLLSLSLSFRWWQLPVWIPPGFHVCLPQGHCTLGPRLLPPQSVGTAPPASPRSYRSHPRCQQSVLLYKLKAKSSKQRLKTVGEHIGFRIS